MAIVRVSEEDFKKMKGQSDWERAFAMADEDLDTSDFDIDQAVLVHPLPRQKPPKHQSQPTLNSHP
jgi:hypothetical protein